MERVSDWLIVSKDEALAARLVMWIRPFGACRVARDTESALQLVQEKRPRCILLDPRLSRLLTENGETEGVALLDILVRYHNLDVLALLASADPDLATACLQAGAREVVDWRELGTEKLARLLGVATGRMSEGEA